MYLTRRLTKGQREPPIDFPEMLTSMEGSLCPLLRRLVNRVKKTETSFRGSIFMYGLHNQYGVVSNTTGIQMTNE